MTGTDNRLGELVEMMRENWPAASADQAAIVVATHRLTRLLQRVAQDALHSHELSPAEFELLSALRTRKPPYRLTPSDLYAAMLMSSGGLTKLLKGLEARGLVVRSKSAGDGRSRPVQLSDKGRVLADCAMASVQAAEEPIMRGMAHVWHGETNMSEALMALAVAAERASEGAGQDIHKG